VYVLADIQDIDNNQVLIGICPRVALTDSKFAYPQSDGILKVRVYTKAIHQICSLKGGEKDED